MKLPDEHEKQYQSLREEILALVADTRRLETLAMGAVGALYAWLAVHRTDVPWVAWFIPAPLVVLGGWRAWALFLRVTLIGDYLRRIEAAFFTENPQLPGWERYFRDYAVTRISHAAIAFWIVLLALTLLAPFCVER